MDKKGSTKEHPDSAVGDKDEKKKWNKAPPTNASPAVPVQPSTTEQEEAKEKTLSDSEKMLAMRFKIYEASQKDIAHILSNWDRVQGVLVSSWSQEEAWQRAEEQNTHLSSRRSRKDREKERLEKERQERERQEKLKALEESQAQAGKGAEGSAKGQDVGVPCLDIQVLDAEDAIGKILESGKLPPAEQVKPCGAQMLRSNTCCFVSHQVTMAQSLVPCYAVVPLLLHDSYGVGKVLSSSHMMERGSAILALLWSPSTPLSIKKHSAPCKNIAKLSVTEGKECEGECD